MHTAHPCMPSQSRHPPVMSVLTCSASWPASSPVPNLLVPLTVRLLTVRLLTVRSCGTAPPPTALSLLGALSLPLTVALASVAWPSTVSGPANTMALLALLLLAAVALPILPVKWEGG